MKVFLAEIIKTRGTKENSIHIVFPLLWTLLFYFYSQGRNIEYEKELFYFCQSLGILFPFAASLVVALHMEGEKEGGFFLSLSSGKNRMQFFGIKLLRFLVWGWLSIFFSLFLFSLLKGQGNIFLFVKLSLIFILTTVPLYGMCFFIASIFPMSVGLVSGVFSTILSALLLTGLGEGIWPLLPFPWAAIYPSLYLTGGVDIFHCLWSLFVCLLLFIPLLIWYNRWEGRSWEG